MRESGSSQAAKHQKLAAQHLEIELIGKDSVKPHRIQVRLHDEIAWKNTQEASSTVTFTGGVCPFETEHRGCTFAVGPGIHFKRTVINGKPGDKFEFRVAFEGKAADSGPRGTPRIIIQK